MPQRSFPIVSDIFRQYGFIRFKKKIIMNNNNNNNDSDNDIDIIANSSQVCNLI